jgi:hypothetical protein
VRVRTAAAAVALLASGCRGDGPCEKGVAGLAALQPATIRSADQRALEPWKKQLDATRAACAADGKSDALDEVAEVDHANTMRWAYLLLADGRRFELAAAPASASAPTLPSSWAIGCSDVVKDGAFLGLLTAGLPREAASHLVPSGDPKAPPADDAVVVGGSPIFLSARGGKLEGAILKDGELSVQQSLPWPEGLPPPSGRLLAARGPDGLGIAWIADLTVHFAVLDVGTEQWSASGEIPLSGDDGGRDLVLGDLAWGRASFGLVLGTARGFAFVEILPTARAVRPAILQPAFVAGAPRIAWDGARFAIAAGSADGAPSMGIWRAADGASPSSWAPLLAAPPPGATIEPLTGELVSRDGALHLAFRVVTGRGPQVHLGHAVPGGPTALETCP